MSANDVFYEILHDALEFSGGKRVLSLAEIRAYTGIKDNRTVKRRFPVVDGTIGVHALARELARGCK